MTLILFESHIYRIDESACLETVADFYPHENPEQYPNIEDIYPPLEELPDSLMLSHSFVEKRPQPADQIQRTMSEVRASDEYVKIVQKYYRQ